MRRAPYVVGLLIALGLLGLARCGRAPETKDPVAVQSASETPSPSDSYELSCPGQNAKAGRGILDYPAGERRFATAQAAFGAAFDDDKPVPASEYALEGMNEHGALVYSYFRDGHRMATVEVKKQSGGGWLPIANSLCDALTNPP